MHERSTLLRSGPRPSGPQEERVLPGALRAALALPLFWKIVLANVVLMSSVGIITTVTLSRPGHEAVSPLVLLVLLLGTLVAATVVNAWIVALALRPLDGLMETAEAVRIGDLSARSPKSSVADARLSRLGRVMNEMLDALEKARDRQKEISHQVLRAEERERERIAAELYAGTAQTLAGVLVRLQILLRSQGPQSATTPLEDMSSQIRAALEEIRAFARRLRPPELDEIGVRAALEAHARQLMQADGPKIVLHGEVPESRLSDDARLALFRVVQEALTNAARHSGAEYVSVTFQAGPDGLDTLVEDDGRGFDSGSVELDDHARLGLLTMIERAGYAEGMTHVDSTPGMGTRVRLVLPWKSGMLGGSDQPPQGLGDELPRVAAADR